MANMRGAAWNEIDDGDDWLGWMAIMVAGEMLYTLFLN